MNELQEVELKLLSQSIFYSAQSRSKSDVFIHLEYLKDAFDRSSSVTVNRHLNEILLALGSVSKLNAQASFLSNKELELLANLFSLLLKKLQARDSLDEREQIGLNFALFIDVITSISLLFPVNYDASQKLVSEELEFIFAETLHALMEQNNVHLPMLCHKYPSLIAHLLFTLLSISTKHLSAKDTLSGLNNNNNINIKNLNRELVVKCLEVSSFIICIDSRLAASFLPGVISNVTKILRGSPKQGQKVFLQAFRLFRDVIVTSIADHHREHLLQSLMADKVDSLKDFFANQEEEPRPPKWEKSPLENPQDKNWLMYTTTKLHDVICLVFGIAKPGSPQTSGSGNIVTDTHVYFETNATVRHEMVVTACTISVNCMRTMAVILPILMQVIVSHVHDEHPTTAQLARTTVIQLSEKLYDKFGLDIVDSLKDSLTKGLLSLPKVVRRSNEVVTFRSVNTLIGYLSFLAALGHHRSLATARMNRFFYVDSVLNSATVTKVIHGLLEVLRLDIYDIRRIRPQTSTLFHPSDKTQQHPDSQHTPFVEKGYPIKSFKYLRDDRIQKAVFKFCRLFGYFLEKHFVIGHLLGIVKSSLKMDNELPNLTQMCYHKEATLLLNEFIVGSFGIGIEEDLSWISQTLVSDNTPDAVSVLRGYLDIDLWNVPTSLDQVISLKEAKMNIGLLSEELEDNGLFVSLLLEGIGLIAQVMGQHFDDHLIHVLFPTYQKLGDSNSVVKRAALATLDCIKSACNYGSVQAMVSANVDYLVDGISSQLRYSELSSLQDGNLPIGLFALRGVLHSVCSDNGEQLEWETIIGLLEGTMDAVFECLDALASSLGSFQKGLMDVIFQICHIIENIFFRFLEPETQKKFVVDFVANLVKHIIEKILNFLSLSNKQSKTLIFDIITLGVKLLYKLDNTQSSENSDNFGGTFLPVIHQIWIPLKKKFVADNAEHLDVFLFLQIFPLVGVISELSKDFVAARIESELLPVCFNILQTTEKQNKILSGDDPRSKLIISILRCLKIVLKNSKPTIESCDKIRVSLRFLEHAESPFKELVPEILDDCKRE